MQDPPHDLDLERDPLIQFGRWLDEARASRAIEPTACALATADPAGRPSVRMVLLKSFDERGFVFATNYESRKADEIEANPRAALCFWWGDLDRQVRIEGRCARTPADESDAIFAARPRGARLAAWASTQSRPVPSRAALEARLQELEHRWTEIPRPAFWGGYRLEPRRIEFWRGREHRLHDRFAYTRPEGASWRIERLAP